MKPRPDIETTFSLSSLKSRSLVRQEDGCTEYGASVDVPTGIPVQNFLGENVVMIVEKWESIEHLKAHLVAPHMADYRVRIKVVCAGCDASRAGTACVDWLRSRADGENDLD